MRRARVALTLGEVGISVLASAAFAQDPGWPRKMTNQGNTLVYYQPQVNDWKDFTDLTWRMAFSLTPAGDKAVLGVVEIRRTRHKWINWCGHLCPRAL